MGDKSPEYIEGVEAFRANKQKATNPYDADKAGASRQAAYDWDSGWLAEQEIKAAALGKFVSITPNHKDYYDELLVHLEDCARESENGRNFARTPHTCRAAAQRIKDLEECLRETRSLVSKAALTGFMEDQPVTDLFRNNGKITKLVPLREKDLQKHADYLASL